MKNIIYRLLNFLRPRRIVPNILAFQGLEKRTANKCV